MGCIVGKQIGAIINNINGRLGFSCNHNLKLSRNLFSAAISAPAGYLVMTLLETGRLNIFGAAITSVISLLAIAIWTWKDSRGSGIKVRLSS